MLRLKDTGRLIKNITSDISGNILAKENSLVIIEKWIDKKHLIVTDTETKQTFKIDFKDININYSDVSKLLLTDLIANKGYNENELLKNYLKADRRSKQTVKATYLYNIGKRSKVLKIANKR